MNQPPSPSRHPLTPSPRHSYAELHTKTNFSFLEGASHPDELVRRAVELEYAALAITDRNSLAGVVRAHGAAKELGLKLLIGAEITPDDAPPVVLLATDRAAYGRLARLITRGRRRAEKGACRLSFDDIAEHAAGLIAAVELQIANCSTPSGQPAAPQSLPEHTDLPPEILNPEPRTLNPHLSPLVPGPWPLVPGPWSLSSGPLHRYREIFGDRCYLLAELHHGPDDRGRLQQLSRLARHVRLPLVAAGDVYYHVPERGALCDVLTAIRRGTTVAAAGEYLFPNAQRYLKSPEAMAALFAGAPEAVRRTLEIADRCTFSLDELRYEYPEELAPPGLTPIEHLTRLTWAGARKRYPRGVPEKVQHLLEHELRLIEQLHYEAYFLTVWDLVRFARRRGILCQGRGSAANSAACYCLGITSVDPERMDVLFERFVSRERNEAPDIDVDFEHQRREEVLQYLYEKYGRDRAGMTAEVITYRPRSAVRDVGKALGFSPDRLDAVAKRLEHFHGEERGKGDSPIFADHFVVPGKSGQSPHAEPELEERCREAGIDPESPLGSQLVELVGELVGFPRHLSQHTGGMVMTRGPLCELVPIENAAMPDRTVIQWNKDDLDELGILKVDCLALGMLSAIRRCFELLRRHYGKELTLANLPEGDQDVYEMICRADTMGVFQIESRAQMSMLPRLRPRCFYDLVIEVAIVRPGPIQGNMVHPYLRRRNGEEPVTYPSRAIRQVLGKTLGIPLFQEQAMRLAVVAAGFTPGEADQLRRAMGAWRRPGLIDQFRKKLIDGMRAKGFSEAYAEAVFTQIRGFGDYGFPESHAASFARLVYVSAWLKYHYPAAFTCALLNSQPMGFYAPAQLVRGAREHGVEVLPVDVNYSDYDCTLEGTRGEGREARDEGRLAAAGTAARAANPPADEQELQIANCKLQIAESTGHAPLSTPHAPLSRSAFALRLGLNMLPGLASAHAKQIEQTRGDRPFRSLDDFARRTGLSRSVLSRLAKAGAFESLRLNRREALWHALGQDQKELPLFDQCMVRCTHPTVDLPKTSPAEEVLADYRTTGLSLKAHPLEFLRAGLDKLSVVPAAELKSRPDGKPVRVAGIVLVRQRPGTAKGITFVTLEDETGTANLIIRPNVWKRYRQAALGATLLLAHGRLQRQGQIIHVLVTKLEDLSGRLKDLGSQSRDFR